MASAGSAVQNRNQLFKRISRFFKFFDFFKLKCTTRKINFYENMPSDQVQYSERYHDSVYEYRHVIVPPHLARLVPKNHLMTETEWRNLGVQQSPGWVHYAIHLPEPHVLLFRRPFTKPDPKTSQ